MICFACGGAEPVQGTRSLAQLLWLTEPQNHYGSPTRGSATTQDKPLAIREAVAIASCKLLHGRCAITQVNYSYIKDCLGELGEPRVISARVEAARTTHRP